jgi:enterochelin esterase-like enzyme
MRVAILLPARPEPSTRYPVVYLFHGWGADETSWFGGNGGGIGVEGAVADLVAAARIPQVVVVSAEIDNSYGVDSPRRDDRFSHGAYERYIIDDLIPGIESRYPVAREAAGRFIGGYSMGGFAALHAAFRHPAMFAGVGALSPAVFRGVIPDRAWLYPDPAARAANDPLRLAATADVTHLRVFLGYGSADYPWIVVATRDIADRLAARGVPARPVSVTGGHETTTWRALAPPMLVSLLGSLPIR